MSPTDEQEKAMRAAARAFAALGDGSAAVDLVAEARAIELAVRAFESDEAFGLLRLWALLRPQQHPLVARTLSFWLTQRLEERPPFAEVVALDLMSLPAVLGDTSTQVNLLTATSGWLRSDEAFPAALLMDLPRFLCRGVNRPPIVHDATVDTLVALAETDLVASFPRRVLTDIVTKLSKAPSPGQSDDPQASADRTEIVARVRGKGLEDLEFWRTALAALEALAKRVTEAGRGDPEEQVFVDAQQFLRRREIEARALLASCEVGAPVQAIRVADQTPRPAFGVVSSVVDSWRALFESACAAFELEPVMYPLEGRSGSYVVNASIDGAPDSQRAFESLRELISAEGATLGERLQVSKIDARTYRALLETLKNHRATLEVIMVNAQGEEPVQHEPITLTFTTAKSVLPPVREIASKTLDSGQIPQADDMTRLFRLLDLLRDGVEVTAESLEVVPRQVNYYKQAGRILHLLSDDNELTGGGTQVARLGHDERRMSLAVLFEESDCGAAWISWSGAATLVELDPESAVAFIRAAVPALSPVTAKRRAQTLTAWQKELAPFHYTRWRVQIGT
jgi:hypothetical protein